MPVHLSSCVLIAALLSASCQARQLGVESASAYVAHTVTPTRSAAVSLPVPNDEPLDCHEVLELSVEPGRSYANNFLDAKLEASVTSPSHERTRIAGFYYGGRTWKVRFKANESGRWTYTYSMAGNDGFQSQGSGAFHCALGIEPDSIQRDPDNPFRWVYGNGQPYFPLGLQDCFDVHAENDFKALMFIDGEDRGSGNAWRVDLDQYFNVYGSAGFNLFRFSQKNCTYPLFDALDQYREGESLFTDELLATARRHGFRVMFGFFGFHNPHYRRVGPVLTPSSQEQIRKEQRFIDYAVARWGVYVDFWQLLNESEASDEWTDLMSRYVRSIDPDGKPVSTSWEKPHLPSIDFNAPHWYETENELASDVRVRDLASGWKQAGKPVIVGEQGNSGMNWDPRSAIRMRIRLWTALFQDIGIVLWNTSWAKNGMHQGTYTPGAASNIYLGPEERAYVRVLQDFAGRIEAGVRMVPVEVSSPQTVRGYGLVSSSVLAVYLHHGTDHETPVQGATVTLDVPAGAVSRGEAFGEWRDPATGTLVAPVSLGSGRQILQIPAFTTDLALLLAPPSSD